MYVGKRTSSFKASVKSLTSPKHCDCVKDAMDVEAIGKIARHNLRSACNRAGHLDTFVRDHLPKKFVKLCVKNGFW